MSHVKRISMSKHLPLRKKGREKFVISSLAKDKGVALMVALRDILRIAKTRKEAEAALRNDEIYVNGQARKDPKFAVNLLDIITIKSMKKSYRLVMKNKRFSLQETGEDNERICKIIGKKILSKGKIQINLDNGYNLLTDLNASVNDSVVLDFKTMKVKKHIPFKEKAQIEVILGNYSGNKGIIAAIKGRNIQADIEGKTVEMPIKNILVIEK